MSCSFDAASESLNAFSTPVDTCVEENVSPVTQRGKTITVNRRSRSCFTPVRSTHPSGRPDGGTDERAPRAAPGPPDPRAGLYSRQAPPSERHLREETP
ncbi:hypothetical protein GCM10015535_24900 [Streptomyces gelaticus]|uniref:DUF397 domain-containing protein n=1 Tax=Streptomyces gelaticus TaxID=285446 RepID=A0ABQ2VXC0_9ACTN|nr:hypothetical protein GCM10015535_24900 [Streptomyces gelaticus]